MATQTPVAELDPQFSSPEARAGSWSTARKLLAEAEVYWLSTVRPDGRPHVTPLIAVWLDTALYICTGAEERKNKNIERNPLVIVTTGTNTLGQGTDVVVEGKATRVTDDRRLQRIADAYLAKYGESWRFTVRDGAFHHDEGSAIVYEIAPRTAFGFGKGEQFSQTRWRF
jgi:nitroimidazol reductase NimA-like FMN-containing flavoprotein (pyridoxamine 5'-phosphate oxidase superfamily)